MSRALTYEDLPGFLKKIVQEVRAMSKVPFSKVDEVAPMLGLESVPGGSDANRIHAGTSVASDYALGRPTLDMMAEIEPFAPLAKEIPGNVETFMPIGFPVPTRKEHTSRRPVVALTHNKVPELPMLNQVPAEKELSKKDLSAQDLENLLAVFKESGMDIREVKLLPSGATRITFDEFFGTRQVRQPEFVRVGGLK